MSRLDALFARLTPVEFRISFLLSTFIYSFPTKVFQIWLQTSDIEHVFIVGSFFHYAGGFEPPSCDDISPNPGRSDPLYIVKAKKKQS